MGKQKKQRRKPRKHNPTGLSSVKESQEAGDQDCTNQDRESALQRMYEEIRSSTVELKLSGLQTLESMSTDSALAVQIAKDGITKVIGPMLVDADVPVRAATASALRHIADNGKEEAYVALLKDDIMTPLSSLLQKLYSEWEPRPHPEKARLDDEREAFVQAVTLLWVLCESNETAVKVCNDDDLTSILIKFLNVTTYGVEITTVVAQCLLSLSEENPTAVKKIREFERILMDLLNLGTDNINAGTLIAFKTAIAALVMRITDWLDTNSMTTVCTVVTVLSKVLAIDCKESLATLTSILPYEKNNFSADAKKRVQECRKTFGAQQQALEILANLCSDDQEVDNDSDVEAEDPVDCEQEDPEDVCMEESPNKPEAALPLEIVEAFSNCEIVKKVWEKTMAVDKDTMEILEQSVEGKAVLKQIHTLRCRAYLCVNNLMSSLDIEILGGTDMYRCWIQIGKVVFNEANPKDIELLEASTAAMRATLQRLCETKGNVFEKLTIEDVEPMLNGERHCPNANIRRNLIRSIGTLAVILINSRSEESRKLIEHLTAFLLDTCTIESEAWVLAETLDTIMDMYAEDDSDQLANDTQLVDKLQSLVPVFKSKVRKQKKYLGDNAAVVSTVNANLTRFIKYKGRRIRSLDKVLNEIPKVVY